MRRNIKNIYLVKIIVFCMLLTMISCNNDNSTPNPEVMCDNLTLEENSKMYLDDKLFTGSCYTEYAFDVPITDEIRSYKNGIRHGVWTKNYQNGSLYYKFSSKNGELHGPYISYHDTGGLSMEGEMNMGSKDGIWKYYDRISGKLVLKEIYKNKTKIDEEIF